MIIVKEKVCDFETSRLKRLFNAMDRGGIIYDYEIKADEECENQKESFLYKIYIFPRAHENRAIETLLKHLQIKFEYGNC